MIFTGRKCFKTTFINEYVYITRQRKEKEHSLKRKKRACKRLSDVCMDIVEHIPFKINLKKTVIHM